MSPLTCVCSQGNKDVARFLLDNGADVNLIDKVNGRGKVVYILCKPECYLQLHYNI